MRLWNRVVAVIRAHFGAEHRLLCSCELCPVFCPSFVPSTLVLCNTLDATSSRLKALQESKVILSVAPVSTIPICKTFKISFLRDVLGNHSMDKSFRLVHWLSIVLFLRKTSQESINLERKSFLDCSSDTLCTREEFGMVTY